jgi:hypothetical protein
LGGREDPKRPLFTQKGRSFERANFRPVFAWIPTSILTFAGILVSWGNRRPCVSFAAIQVEHQGDAKLKLTDEDAEFIRNHPEIHWQVLADHFGISRRHVYFVRSGKSRLGKSRMGRLTVSVGHDIEIPYGMPSYTYTPRQSCPKKQAELVAVPVDALKVYSPEAEPSVAIERYPSPRNHDELLEASKALLDATDYYWGTHGADPGRIIDARERLRKVLEKAENRSSKQSQNSGQAS